MVPMIITMVPEVMIEKSNVEFRRKMKGTRDGPKRIAFFGSSHLLTHFTDIISR
jgi:hypothetical protein